MGKQQAGKQHTGKRHTGKRHTAAFFRVEGTVVKRGVLNATAYLAANGKGLGERVMRLGGFAVAAGFRGIMGGRDRTLSNRVAYVMFRGMSEDRVLELGEEYWDGVLKGKLLDRGVELVLEARRAGHTTVLLTENIHSIIAPLKDALGADHMVCNRLEFKDGECTGRLLDPVIGGHESRKWAEDFARNHDIDLSQSVAYASGGPDLLLLAAVGNPCAVNPDFALRRAATEADWPVVEYSA